MPALTPDNPVLGVGLRYPIRLASDGHFDLSADLDRIRQSIVQILHTIPGERVMRPEFGSRLPSLVFENVDDPVTHRSAEAFVVEAIDRDEPRVIPKKNGVSVGGSPGFENRLGIRFRYRIIKTNVEDNWVYPFYLEGAKEPRVPL